MSAGGKQPLIGELCQPNEATVSENDMDIKIQRNVSAKFSCRHLR